MIGPSELANSGKAPFCSKPLKYSLSCKITFDYKVHSLQEVIQSTFKDYANDQLQMVENVKGSFKKYVTVGGGWVRANFVTNCYEKYKGWERQITFAT